MVTRQNSIRDAVVTGTYTYLTHLGACMNYQQVTGLLFKLFPRKLNIMGTALSKSVNIQTSPMYDDAILEGLKGVPLKSVISKSLTRKSVFSKI